MVASKSADAPFRAVLEALTPDDWAELRALLGRVEEHGAPFGRWVGSELGATGVRECGYPEESRVVGDTVEFLYGHDMVVPFDWPGWKGKAAVERGDVARLAEASADDCLRYLTVIVRAERFSTGTLLCRLPG
ncbi:Uncharacterised protein [Rhodococcus rhodochrous]|uniref:DUF6508 domain-containing protein n=1 Tax=Rhodococcus rhodochrous TaxID=1829 RepID=UPI000ABF9F20|nr:DUF6508 domain-containing protein [Rhodococcus rhodochrous]MDO1484659.1 hypothetical protein [Rhodococcus rhodochrous]SNV27075.1 Uncharacterised protein [Rhodococcus rhodochrous]